jgi:hypothetical protein
MSEQQWDSLAVARSVALRADEKAAKRAAV